MTAKRLKKLLALASLALTVYSALSKFRHKDRAEEAKATEE